MLHVQETMHGRNQEIAENFVIPFPNSNTVDAVMRRIASIDLSMVKAKLMDEEEGQGWTQIYTDYVEQRYWRYLCMVCLNPDGSVVPTKDIDLFWHQHILDTRAYARDCETIFGEFLHHYPYFGMNGPLDAQDLNDSFEETKVTWAHLFGEPYCVEPPATMMAARCQGGQSKCHKCTVEKPTCHKCTSRPGPDTVTCKKCKSSK